MKVPEWVKTIKEGQYIYVKTLEELAKEYGSVDEVPCGWNEHLNCMAGRKIRVTERMADNLNHADSERTHIFRKEIEGWDFVFSVGMLKRTNKGNPKKKEEHKETKQYDLRLKEKDQSIIDEMISKVDRNRIRTLFQIGTRMTGKITVSEKELDSYLQKWAEAKYEFYILFGRNLKIENHIQENMNVNLFYSMYEELKINFPKYAFALNYISYVDAYENKLTYESNIDSIQKYCGHIFNMNMKVTKFLSKLYEDDNFDIAISKLFQNKKIDTIVAISIDPYDYLTMSITNYTWRSCFDISSGCFSNAAFSALVDESSMVCYTHNGNDFNFTRRGKKFTGNNKKDRWLLYVNKSNCSYLFGGNMGSPSQSAINWSDSKVADLIKEKFSDIEWKSANFGIKYPTTKYHHFQDSIFIRRTPSPAPQNIDLDVKLTCPICGKEFDRRTNFICIDCEREHTK